MIHYNHIIGRACFQFFFGKILEKQKNPAKRIFKKRFWGEKHRGKKETLERKIGKNDAENLSALTNDKEKCIINR